MGKEKFWELLRGLIRFFLRPIKSDPHMVGSSLVRISFPVENGTHASERLWAKPTADGGFVLDNSPYFVYGVSYGDTVVSNALDGDLVFERVSHRGGHSTYRLKLPRGQSHAYFLEFWPRLAAFNCTYEGSGGDRRLYVIDIPPGASVHAVYAVLTELEKAKVIEFEEAFYYNPSKEHSDQTQAS